MPPLACGIDSPTGAVFVLLAASAGPAVLAAGGSPVQAVQSTLLLFTGATLLSGLLLCGLGAARWGSYLRFVPYFVVAGFLAATGWLLIVGGVRMASGRTLAMLATPWAVPEAARLASAVAALVVLLALKRWARSALAMPTALLLMWGAGALVLQRLGLSGSEHGWYLPSLGPLVPWFPLQALQALQAAPLSLPLALRFVPELLAVVVIALVSLVTKISSLEVSRKTSGDLDNELRAHGVATLVSVPLGGIASSMQHAACRWAAAVCCSRPAAPPG